MGVVRLLSSGSILIIFRPHNALPVELLLAIASATAKDYIASHGRHLQRPLSMALNGK
jgi:hypothetical protein